MIRGMKRLNLHGTEIYSMSIADEALVTIGRLERGGKIGYRNKEKHPHEKRFGGCRGN